MSKTISFLLFILCAACGVANPSVYIGTLTYTRVCPLSQKWLTTAPGSNDLFEASRNPSCLLANGTLAVGLNTYYPDHDHHARIHNTSVYSRGEVGCPLCAGCLSPKISLFPPKPIINTSTTFSGSYLFDVIVPDDEDHITLTDGLQITKKGFGRYAIHIADLSVFLSNASAVITAISKCGAIARHAIALVNSPARTQCEPVPVMSSHKVRCDSAPILVAGRLSYSSGSCNSTCSTGTQFYCTDSGWRYSGPQPVNCTNAFATATKVPTTRGACILAAAYYVPEGFGIAAKDESNLNCYYTKAAAPFDPVLLKFPPGATISSIPVDFGVARDIYDVDLNTDRCTTDTVKNGTEGSSSTDNFLLELKNFVCTNDLSCLKAPPNDATTSYTDTTWTACGYAGNLPNAFDTGESTDYVLRPGTDDDSYNGYYAASSSFKSSESPCSEAATNQAAKLKMVISFCATLLDYEIACSAIQRNAIGGATSDLHFTCFSELPVFPFDRVTYSKRIGSYIVYTAVQPSGEPLPRLCAGPPGTLSAIREGTCIYYSPSSLDGSCNTQFPFELYSPSPYVLCDDVDCVRVSIPTSVGVTTTYWLQYITAKQTLRIDAVNGKFYAISDAPSCGYVVEKITGTLALAAGTARANRTLAFSRNKALFSSPGSPIAGYRIPLYTLPDYAFFTKPWPVAVQLQKYVNTFVYASIRSPKGTAVLAVKVLAIIGAIIALLGHLYLAIFNRHFRFTKNGHRTPYALVNLLAYTVMVIPLCAAPFLYAVDVLLIVLGLFTSLATLAFGKRFVMPSLGWAWTIQWFILYRHRRFMYVKKFVGIRPLNMRGNRAVGIAATWCLLAVILIRPSKANYDSGTTYTQSDYTVSGAKDGDTIRYTGSTDSYLSFGTGFKSVLTALDRENDKIAYVLTIELVETANQASCSYSHTCGSVTLDAQGTTFSDDEACSCVAVQNPRCLFYERDRTGCASMHSASDIQNCRTMVSNYPGRCETGGDIDYDNAVSSWASYILSVVPKYAFLGDIKAHSTMANIGLLGRGSTVTTCFAQPMRATEYVHVATCANLNLHATARITITRSIGVEIETLADELVVIDNWGKFEAAGTTIEFKPPDMTVSLPNNVGVYVTPEGPSTIFSRVSSISSPNMACNSMVGTPTDGPVLNLVDTGLSASQSGCSMSHNPILDVNKFVAGFGYLNTESDCLWTASVSADSTAACRDIGLNNAPICGDSPVDPVQFNYDLPVVSLSTSSCAKIIPFTVKSDVTFPYEEEDVRIPGTHITISNCVGAWGREGARCDVSTTQAGTFQQQLVNGQPQFSPIEFRLESIVSAMLLFPTGYADTITLWDGTSIVLDTTNIVNPVLQTPDPGEDTSILPVQADPTDPGFDWWDLFETVGYIILLIIVICIVLWLAYLILPFMCSACCAASESTSGSRLAGLAALYKNQTNKMK